MGARPATDWPEAADAGAKADMTRTLAGHSSVPHERCVSRDVSLSHDESC